MKDKKKSKKTIVKKTVKIAEKTKTILRIPTLDQYAYVEVEFLGTVEEAIGEYHRLTTLVRGGTGLEQKEFNAALDRYMVQGDMEADVFAGMNLDQQGMIQAIKRSRARTKDKLPVANTVIIENNNH